MDTQRPLAGWTSWALARGSRSSWVWVARLSGQPRPGEGSAWQGNHRHRGPSSLARLGMAGRRCPPSDVGAMSVTGWDLLPGIGFSPPVDTLANGRIPPSPGPRALMGTPDRGAKGGFDARTCRPPARHPHVCRSRAAPDNAAGAHILPVGPLIGADDVRLSLLGLRCGRLRAGRAYGVAAPASGTRALAQLGPLAGRWGLSAPATGDLPGSGALSTARDLTQLPPRRTRSTIPPSGHLGLTTSTRARAGLPLPAHPSGTDWSAGGPRAEPDIPNGPRVRTARPSPTPGQGGPEQCR